MKDVKVLLIAGKESDIESECRILRHSGYKVEVVASLQDAKGKYSVNRVSAHF